MDESQRAEFAVLKNQVEDLVAWRGKFTDDLLKRFDKIEERITTLIAGRPSWAVTVILTVLTSSTVGLLVGIFHGAGLAH